MSESEATSQLSSLFRQTLIDTLKDRLQTGQVISAQILEILKDGDLLLFFEGGVYSAKSDIPFQRGEFIQARVQALQPGLLLQLLPRLETPPSVTGQQPYRDSLHQLGIIPGRGNLEAARAMVEEGIPLTRTGLEDFLKAVRALNLTDFKDLQAAARLTRLELPLETSWLREIKPLLNAPANPALKPAETIALLARAIATLPPEAQIVLKTGLAALQAEAGRTLLPGLDNTLLTANHIRDSVQSHPSLYERHWMTQGLMALLDTRQAGNLIQELQSTVQDLQTILNAENAPSPVQSMRSLSQFLPALQGSLDLFAREFPPLSHESAPHPLNETQGKLLLKILQQMDALFHLQDSLKSLPRQGVAESLRQSLDAHLPRLQQHLDNLLFKDIPRDRLEAFSRAAGSMMPPAAGNPGSLPPAAPPLKGLIFEALLAAVEAQNAVKTTHPVDTPPRLDAPFAELQDQLQHILRHQVHWLDPQDASSSHGMTLPVTMDGNTVEIPMVFQELPRPSGDSTKEGKYFRVYFSLDLSRLGHVEIHLLEHDGNLDLHFLAEQKNSRESFDQHKNELADRLRAGGSLTVNIHSTLGRVPPQTAPSFYIQRDPSRIDLTV